MGLFDKKKDAAGDPAGVGGMAGSGAYDAAGWGSHYDENDGSRGMQAEQGDPRYRGNPSTGQPSPSRVSVSRALGNNDTDDDIVLGAHRMRQANASRAHTGPPSIAQMSIAAGSEHAMGDALTPEKVAMSVAACFANAVPYYRLSSSILVACPSEQAMSGELFSEEASLVYNEACYQGLNFAARDSLEPHVFELVSDAYAHMRRLTQDQLFILSGASGSGKSESAKFINDQLCILASHAGRHNTRAQHQLSHVTAVVEAFSNALTLESRNSTRVGLWQEIQFNERGRISGNKVVAFGLDRWRVSTRLAGERNFNIFYYLLHGATSAERQKWQFRHSGDESWFTYLSCERASKKLVAQHVIKAAPPPPTHYATMMDQLRMSLRACGITPRMQNCIFQVLAAIMHLGNAEFADAGDKSEEAATVKNMEEIDFAAQFLGISTGALSAALTYKTTLVNNDLCTVFLNSLGARNQRDALARTLYHLVYYWLIDAVNQHLSDPDAVNHIAVLQMYGFSGLALTKPGAASGTKAANAGSFEQFAFNMANERLQGYVLREVLGDDCGISQELHDDSVGQLSVPWVHRLDCMRMLCGEYTGRRGGIVGAIEEHAADDEFSHDDIQLINNLNRNHGRSACYVPGPPPNKREKSPPLFGIRHFMGTMSYSVDGFCKHNMDLEVSPDFYTLFKEASHSKFAHKLFGITQIALDFHPEEESTIVGTFLSTRPASYPSVRKPSQLGSSLSDPVELEPLDNADPANTFIGEISSALEDIFAAADYCKAWHVLHVRAEDQANITSQPGVIDHSFIQRQVKAMAIVEMAQRRAPSEFSVSFTFERFIDKYSPIINIAVSDPAAVVTAATLVPQVASAREWVSGVHYVTGHQKIFMTERVWRSIDMELRAYEKQRHEARRRGGIIADSEMFESLDGQLPPPHIPFDDAASSIFGSEGGTDSRGFVPERDLYADDDGNESDDMMSAGYGGDEKGDWDTNTEFGEHSDRDGNGNGDSENRGVKGEREGLVEEIDTSNSRRCWSRTTNCLTFMIPNWLMNCCGMKREDIRMAWREKVAICLIIFFMWCFVLFFIIGLGWLMCPKQFVYNLDEVGDHTERDDAYVALRGKVYDITNFLNQEHGKSRGGASPEDMLMYAGQDVNASFPLALRIACPGLITQREDPNWLMYLKSDPETETQYPFVHKAGSLANSKIMMRQDFYFRHVLPKMKLFQMGDVVWELKYIKSMHHKGGAYWRVINGEVFNLNPYFMTRDSPENVDIKKWRFLHRLVESIFEDAGARDTDITKYWRMLPLTKQVRAANYHCLKNLFYVGKVDSRHSFRCLFPNFLLLAAACLLMVVIGIKFLASLQLSSRRRPQKHDKFVICQVPCYTEGETSLRRTIDSLATLGYDDKHRLLFIICDGNIVGSGNDRPTPRIVLDILGVDPKLDPPSRSFRSIGEGGQQHNMAKVYSGLYEYEGHVVPYLVVAKIGKPTEKSRPGNRGKRDSQMLLLHFLNRLHFEAPMSPLDLEIYHQMKNVIGVHPSLYEYVLMVDADTEVYPDSLTRLVACMVHDAKVIGICGETQLTNEDFSWTTMIQVYEYFISHHMAKAFESLFGSVTCLPGCFCMYRLRTQRGSPLIISKNVIDDYAENHVDTLHKKNLLSLGEDRYLTTLMMKYFPQYKMTFTADAKCKTTAPDTWSVLLSQRRRWINSTVHNLVELVFLPEMCGFCCFSMRFVVFIDLFGTLTMPCTLFYLAYLIYVGVSKISDIGYISLVLIGAIYGLQAIIFILKRQWQHIGWMIIYLFAYPLWSFFIPVYAFWHMDDFSWGNTRIVVGEDGKRQIFVKDEEPFDPSEIPMKTWAEYESEIFERQRQMQDLEAVAQAIDEFGMGGVRPVSRFTQVTGLGRQTAMDKAQSVMGQSFENQTIQMQMPRLGTPVQYSYYSSSMPSPQQAATSNHNLLQMSGSQMPSDEAIAATISNILDNSDLSTITMKQVRDELSRIFGVDLSSRREFIQSTIQSMIQSRV